MPGLNDLPVVLHIALLAMGLLFFASLTSVVLVLVFHGISRLATFLENRADLNIADASVPSAFPVILDSQVEMVTVERFLNDMAREKPIRFSPQQLDNFTQNYANRLGSGGFGVVYKGEFPNGVPVAVKVFNRSLEKIAEEQFMAEVSTIGRTYHINLVRLYGFCFDASVRALVYEYMDNGSLDRLLFTAKSKEIGFEKLYEIAVGTAKGIAYLHEECLQRIIHYDIKPGNVLLDANFTPKVADFGLAKLCKRDTSHVVMSGYRGTPGYAAPEMYMPFPVTRQCDVYSFGMLLFEIVGRRRNLDDNQTESREWLPKWVWDKYERGEMGAIATGCEIEAKDRDKAERMCKVALWCVQYLPEKRPPMSSVVKMLEGAEIIAPHNPFHHLTDSGVLNIGVGSSCRSRATASTAKSFYRETTPTMRKYEIEVDNSKQRQ